MIAYLRSFFFITHSPQYTTEEQPYIKKQQHLPITTRKTASFRIAPSGYLTSIYDFHAAYITCFSVHFYP